MYTHICIRRVFSGLSSKWQKHTSTHMYTAPLLPACRHRLAYTSSWDSRQSCAFEIATRFTGHVLKFRRSPGIFNVMCPSQMGSGGFAAHGTPLALALKRCCRLHTVRRIVGNLKLWAKVLKIQAQHCGSSSGSLTTTPLTDATECLGRIRAGSPKPS